MNQKNRLFLIVLSIFLVNMFSSCIRKEPECDQERPFDEVNVGFYDLEEGEATQKSQRFNRIEAINTDFRFPEDIDTLKIDFSFELDSRDTISTYIFVTALSTDTLELAYDRQLEWLSEECGPMHRFENLRINSHTFDSVSLIQNIINIQVDENIRIFN